MNVERKSYTRLISDDLSMVKLPRTQKLKNSIQGKWLKLFYLSIWLLVVFIATSQGMGQLEGPYPPP